MAGRAGGAGAGAPAGPTAGGINEPPTRVQNYKDELVAKWKALSVASFDVLDALRAVSSNDNEKRDFLQTVVREAAHRGVLDGTPYITSLADLLRGEDEVQEQPQPAEDLGMMPPPPPPLQLRPKYAFVLSSRVSNSRNSRLKKS